MSSLYISRNFSISLLISSMTHCSLRSILFSVHVFACFLEVLFFKIRGMHSKLSLCKITLLSSRIHRTLYSYYIGISVLRSSAFYRIGYWKERRKERQEEGGWEIFASLACIPNANNWTWNLYHNLNLLCGWQRATYLIDHLLPPRVCYQQKAESVAKESGLKSANWLRIWAS